MPLQCVTTASELLKLLFKTPLRITSTYRCPKPKIRNTLQVRQFHSTLLFPMVYLTVTAYYLWLQEFVFYLDLLIHYLPKVTPFCIMEVKSLGEFMFFSDFWVLLLKHLKRKQNRTFNTLL